MYTSKLNASLDYLVKDECCLLNTNIIGYYWYFKLCLHY